MSSKQLFIGIIPAAGAATRLRPFSYPKELMPVAFEACADGGYRPVVALDLAFTSVRQVTDRCIVVISTEKQELARYAMSNSGLKTIHIVDDNPTGLLGSLRRALEWFPESHFCLALPDTIISPSTAMREVCEVLRDEPLTDLVLGVFPTTEASRLGPVEYGPDLVVTKVFDKPSHPTVMNTWGIAAWNAQFTRFLLESSESDDYPIGLLFNQAVSQFSVRAAAFRNGHFVDIGTAQGIGALLSDCQCMKRTPR